MSRTRTCIGCGQASDGGDLVRLVLGPEGTPIVDLRGGAFGRGAWVHPRPDCLRRAAAGGAARSFRASVRSSAEELAAALAEAAGRRVVALLRAARGAGKIAVGSEASEAAWERGAVALCLVADDARAAASRGWVARAGAQGRAVLWGTRATLGGALGRDEVAVAALLDPGLAAAVRRAVALTALPADLAAVADAGPGGAAGRGRRSAGESRREAG